MCAAMQNPEGVRAGACACVHLSPSPARGQCRHSSLVRAVPRQRKPADTATLDGDGWEAWRDNRQARLLSSHARFSFFDSATSPPRSHARTCQGERATAPGQSACTARWRNLPRKTNAKSPSHTLPERRRQGAGQRTRCQAEEGRENRGVYGTATPFLPFPCPGFTPKRLSFPGERDRGRRARPPSSWTLARAGRGGQRRRPAVAGSLHGSVKRSPTRRQVCMQKTACQRRGDGWGRHRASRARRATKGRMAPTHMMSSYGVAIVATDARCIGKPAGRPC